MSKVELLMPKMGESIIEATILKWVKNVGDKVSVDDTILEIATDKVDSEIPSPVNGVISEILFPEDSVVEVGKIIAIIATEGEDVKPLASPSVKEESITEVTLVAEKIVADIPTVNTDFNISNSEDRFYSPLVKSIAKEEKITQEELNNIKGTGANDRVTKQDILSYIATRSISAPKELITTPQKTAITASSSTIPTTASTSLSGNIEIIEMDRMRKLIADHMVMSKQTSPHVTSFVEADVTNLVKWREANKKKFQEKYGTNITFTPLFVDAVVKAIKDFPLVNISLDGSKIIVKKDINIGMAAALPSGNLIVPVIKNADLLNLAGLAKMVNDLASRARENKLKPEEIKDGTFTITNVGTFGNLMGTPIINQPQVAILATGAIVKKPAVLETEFGDVIAVRQMMFLSLSYDHRVVDGSLGGAFLKRISDYLEKFDPNTLI
ncbi:MAG: 2-oxo acid dehydrogenase subunit E2 [Saprospiraceae bacterium]|jgi:2-oxoglutarate dehydrogenase E2 component (dihydrolipoamide succinyltransferase)|nr:2-oxo acid dehydrogenase subunit E2 [Saprospiraceae bacterium]